MLARTALSAAVTVALVSAPATIGVPAFGSVADSGSNPPGTPESSPSPTATETHEPSESPQPTQSPDDDLSPDNDPSPDADPEEDETDDPKESTLPEGTFEVRKAPYRDTFALFGPRGDLFESDDTDFTHSDIEITLPNIQGEDRDFVLTDSNAALEIIDGSGSKPYRPGANDEGHREFTFEVDGQGEMTEPTDKGPESTPEPTDDPTVDPSPDPTEDPTPTPTGTPDPSPEPTDDPDDGDDREDEGNDGDGSGDDGGSDDEDSGDDESDSGERDDGGLTDDPSTGNGSDNGGRDDPRESAPTGDDDWVPTGPQRPDYSDPVPQPPGAGEDDAITPDGEVPAPPGDEGSAEENGDSDDVATDSASDEDGGSALPWQIGVVVAIGAAAIGFILFVAGRRRRD